MEKIKHEKELLLHMLFGTVIFLSIAVVAIGLDLLAQWAAGLGVSGFTHQALTITAHLLMVVDLVLFVTYTVKTTVQIIKEMMK